MRNLILSSRRREKIVGLSLALSLFAGSAAALAVNPQDNVRGFYDTLLTTMRYGPTLGRAVVMRDWLRLSTGSSTSPR